MTCTYEDENHEYRINGVVVPSVTQCTSLLQDFTHIPPGVLKAAAAFGTHVHTACELWDDGTLDEDALDPALAPWLEAWKKFIHESGFKPWGAESVVYSTKHGYAGRLDRVGMLNNKLTILDIKTPSKISPAAGPQLAGYAQAWEEMTGNKIKSRHVVQLRGDGHYRLHPFNEKHDVHIFNACLSVVKWRMANE